MRASRGSQQTDNRILRAAVAIAAGLLTLAPLAGCGGSTATTATTTGQQAQGSSTQTTGSSPGGSKTAVAPSTTADTSKAAGTATAPTKAAPAPKAEHTPANEKIVLSSPAINPNGGQLQARYTCDGQDSPLPLEWKGVPPGTAELMVDIIPVKPVNEKLQFSWAVAHIPPTTHELVEGKLPPGAVVGTNSQGEVGYHLCPPKGPAESYVAIIFALPHRLSAQAGFDPRALRHEAEQQASYQNLLIFNYQRH